jgi:hypothetical protein
MKIRNLPPLFLALTTLACATTDEGATKASAAPSMEEMNEAMMRAGTPGAQHKALDPFVGKWNAKITMWMDPSQPAMESTGTMESSWKYDGRYLDQKFEGDFMGQPFHGTGMWGFDVAAGKYIGFWYDSGSTGLANFSGAIPKDGKTFVSTMTMTDPLTGKPTSGENVITLDSPSQHTMTMYENRGGQKTKTMTIVYTRK